MRVFGYGRHSTDKQSITEEVQQAKVEGYIKQALPEAEYHGWLYDQATSGSMPLFERPAGRNILALAQPGDHIVWSKLDRAFRSVVDGASTLAMLAHRGIFVHSLDLGLDTSTAVGRCVCTVMLAFAELEREYASERTTEALSAKREAGLPYGRRLPIGWQKVGKKKQSRFEPLIPERAQAEQFMEWNMAGLSLETIERRMRGVRRWTGKQWNRNSIRAAIIAARQRFPKVTPASSRRRSVASGRSSG
jgi:DNA invertase Pin-like site-specific DNA recombinase